MRWTFIVKYKRSKCHSVVFHLYYIETLETQSSGSLQCIRNIIIFVIRDTTELTKSGGVYHIGKVLAEYRW